MDTFGVTAHGVPSEIAFAVAPNYCEPRAQAPRQNCCPERWLDTQLLRADGQALASKWRWDVQRQASVRRPTGPRDRFRFPITTSMDIGWSLVDPALNGAHFLCNEMRCPLANSDLFRVWHEQMLHTSGDELSLRTRRPIDLAELTPKVRCLQLPDRTATDTSLTENQIWARERESQMLQGVLQGQIGNNGEELRGAALRQQLLEEAQQFEIEKRRGQREGTNVLRKTLKELRDRKDLMSADQLEMEALKEKQREEQKEQLMRPHGIRAHCVQVHGMHKLARPLLAPEVTPDIITQNAYMKMRTAQYTPEVKAIICAKQAEKCCDILAPDAPGVTDEELMPPYHGKQQSEIQRKRSLMRIYQLQKQPGFGQKIINEEKIKQRRLERQRLKEMEGKIPFTPCTHERHLLENPRRRVRRSKELRQHARSHVSFVKVPQLQPIPLQPFMKPLGKQQTMSKQNFSTNKNITTTTKQMTTTTKQMITTTKQMTTTTKQMTTTTKRTQGFR